MEVLNLTPHEVNIHLDGEIITIPPSGDVARVTMTREQVGEIDVDGHAVPVFRATLGEPEGLPEKRDGVAYIVSRVVAEAARDRDDLLVPDGAIRDEKGRIVGCRAFARV